MVEGASIAHTPSRRPSLECGRNRAFSSASMARYDARTGRFFEKTPTALAEAAKNVPSEQTAAVRKGSFYQPDATNSGMAGESFFFEDRILRTR